MKYFWHFFKSNFKYNKLELAISYGLTLLVFAVFFYFRDSKGVMSGETLISVSFYALLYAFFSNKKKFNLKYLVSLPLSKASLILVKSAADVVFFIPSMALAFIGIRNSDLDFAALPLALILVQFAVMVSFFLFDNDVEQPRLENTRASFVNRLVYVRKMVDKTFLLIVLGVVGSMVYALPVSMLFKQYLFILMFVFALAFKYRKSLKLMQDESLSYFIFRRDGLRMGWKLGLAAAPVIAVMFAGPESLYPSPYGKHEIFSLIKSKEEGKLSEYLEQTGEDALKIKGANGYTPALAAVAEGKVEALETLLGRGFELAWEPSITDKRFKGFLPVHLAAVSNNTRMMEKVLHLKQNILDLPAEDSLETPLMLAVKRCHNEMVDFLLARGANPNARNQKGDTPLMVSVKKGCDTSTALLLEYHALTTLKDKEGKLALDHMSKRDTMYYFLKRKTPVSRGVKRKIASEELGSSEDESKAN